MNNPQRYHRQMILPEIGQSGQNKLSKARVLCIGAGGLGCPALQYLTAAGVGYISIVDHDTVDESNLQRQILYRTDQIGQNKAVAAAANLKALNPGITITAHTEQLTAENALGLFEQVDLIIDGTDNFDTKFLINDAAYKADKPVIYASILGFSGQIAVFNHQNGPCYRCLFPSKPPQETLNCAEAGIIGAVAGIMGSLQALEAIKIITQEPTLETLDGKLWVMDLKSLKNSIIQLPKDPKCPTCSLNKEAVMLQATTTQHNNSNMELSVSEAKTFLQSNPDTLLLDVREDHEWDAGRIDGADHLPLSILLEGHRPDLSKDANIVLYCLKGMRSMQALQILKSQGYQKLKSIRGGFTAWLAEKSS